MRSNTTADCLQFCRPCAAKTASLSNVCHVGATVKTLERLLLPILHCTTSVKNPLSKFKVFRSHIVGSFVPLIKYQICVSQLVNKICCLYYTLSNATGFVSASWVTCAFLVLLIAFAEHVAVSNLHNIHWLLTALFGCGGLNRFYKWCFINLSSPIRMMSLHVSPSSCLISSACVKDSE